MQTRVLSTDEISRRIKDITAVVRSTVRRETGSDYDESLIEDSIMTCVANSLERIEESLPEMFTSPERQEFQEMTRILANKGTSIAAAKDLEPVAIPAPIFSGHKTFSKQKLAAMIEHLTSKGHYVYKTSLNKLLFYSDLSYFYLRGHGISGAVYYNRPFGPVADPASSVLAELIEANRVKVLPRTQTLESTRIREDHELTAEELKILDWVADTYGKMTASAISDLSHKEKGYENTLPNQPIAYAYAEFLTHLPPKDLMEQ